jgi:succinate dehydrogenase / fumarate reductase flavoprotein subunit
MGGLPTDLDGRVLADAQGNVIPGLYAAGESACVSVHGANRLGTNSLVDLIVFGRRAGRHMLKLVHETSLPTMQPNPDMPAREQVAELLARPKGENPADLRARLQDVMMDKVSVVRNAESMNDALNVVEDLRSAYSRVSVEDKGDVFNTDLTETLELGYMLDLAEAVVVGALAREESRGAHYRTDFEKRDDVNWLSHTVITKDGPKLEISKKPVTITTFEPKERVY